MNYTMLGTTMIPQIAVGTWSWGNGACPLAETDLRPVFERAVRFGFTLWDTAPFHDHGAGEALLGRLAAEYPYLQYSTRFTSRRLQRRSAMEDTLATSLQHLGIDHTDLFWVHAPAHTHHWIRELIPLMQAGKFRYAGVVNHTLEEIKTVAALLEQAGLKLAAVQHHYSLLYRAPETAGILDWCRQNKVVFFAYLVLEQGALTGLYSAQEPLPKDRRGRLFSPAALGKLQPLFDTMKTIGRAHRADAAQLAIAWAIAKGTVPIVGMTKPHHVTEEAQAVYLHLEPWEIQQLELAAGRTGISIPAQGDRKRY